VILALFEIIQRNYATIYFGRNSSATTPMPEKICGDKIKIVDPSLEALDDLLRSESVDYVGTRLHAASGDAA